LPKAVFDQYLRIIAVSTKIPLSQLRKSLKDAQKFEDAAIKLQKTFICMDAKCDAVLTVDDKGLPTRRQPCGHFYDKNKGACYIFVLPIEQQLICLLKNGGIGLKENGIYLLSLVTTTNSLMLSVLFLILY
jgi:hypothetical protein